MLSGEQVHALSAVQLQLVLLSLYLPIIDESTHCKRVYTRHRTDRPTHNYDSNVRRAHSSRSTVTVYIGASTEADFPTDRLSI